MEFSQNFVAFSEYMNFKYSKKSSYKLNFLIIFPKTSVFVALVILSAIPWTVKKTMSRSKRDLNKMSGIKIKLFTLRLKKELKLPKIKTKQMAF